MTESDQIRVNTFVEQQLDRFAGEIEALIGAEVMGITGPIAGGLDEDVRKVVEERTRSGRRLGILLDTAGGIIEVVERIVTTIRHHYDEVIMIIPNRAMSAGTVLAMSGDSIMMDYFSCLGPIDPQVYRNGKYVPALSYLAQVERMIERSKTGELTSAEMILLQQLDLAELHSFEQARDLSISLLKKWLATYKFKDWTKTETRQLPVTQEMREERAVEVASKLMGHGQQPACEWKSHSRPISMEILRRDLNLKIDDFGDNQPLSRAIRQYSQFLSDYMIKIAATCVVHAPGVCVKW